MMLNSLMIRNNLCYTEDDILVQELYLYDIPAELKEHELLHYFNSYGSVVRLQLSDKIKRNPFYNTCLKKRRGKRLLKTGCVLFANPLAAPKVLLSQIHHVNEYRFHVKPSDSWLQPEAYGPANGEPEQSHIRAIPDDCLIRILQFLPLIDQLHFLRYCTPFRDVHQLDTRTLQKTVDFEIFNPLTIWDIRDYFFIFGRNIECLKGSIRLSIRCGRFYEFFGSSCVNLKSLELSNTFLSARNVFEMFSNTNKLEHVELRNCELTDESMGALRNLKNLKWLSLANNFQLSGGLPELPTCIETLNLCECGIGILSEDSITAWKALPKLKKLNIQRIRTIHTYIYDYLNSVETIRFSIYEQTDYKKIAKLPNLRRIQIADSPHEIILGKLLNQLVAKKARQLEELEIWDPRKMTNQMLMQIAKLTGLRRLRFWQTLDINDDVLKEFTQLKELEHIFLRDCTHVSDSGVVHLILGCPKLREVYLTRCSKITENLVHIIVDNVQRQVNNREEFRVLPIHFHVGSTNIRESIKTHPNVVASNVVKIFFDAPIHDYSL
ncbi:F-box/LRR-repeat protein 14-like isoform X2 [Drosophila tropicalis]|uniref:F-box/LRR-repeat protein 14-like isoform X2 n=1 Tax=Drosophila tropicalis TaxID=46794 RepID=UPI0035ABFCC8